MWFLVFETGIPLSLPSSYGVDCVSTTSIRYLSSRTRIYPRAVSFTIFISIYYKITQSPSVTGMNQKKKLNHLLTIDTYVNVIFRFCIPTYIDTAHSTICVYISITHQHIFDDKAFNNILFSISKNSTQKKVDKNIFRKKKNIHPKKISSNPTNFASPIHINLTCSC